jgi:hypothetical protein
MGRARLSVAADGVAFRPYIGNRNWSNELIVAWGTDAGRLGSSGASEAGMFCGCTMPSWTVREATSKSMMK